jgi:hypothetical protein
VCCSAARSSVWALLGNIEVQNSILLQHRKVCNRNGWCCY